MSIFLFCVVCSLYYHHFRDGINIHIAIHIKHEKKKHNMNSYLEKMLLNEVQDTNCIHMHDRLFSYIYIYVMVMTLHICEL